MHRIFAVFMVCLTCVTSVSAQVSDAPGQSTVETNPAVSTLEDIMRRQEGLTVDEGDRAASVGDPANAQPADGQLGTLGGQPTWNL